MAGVLGSVRNSGTTEGAERLRRLLGMATSSPKGLVDLEERVRMH